MIYIQGNVIGGSSFEDIIKHAVGNFFETCTTSSDVVVEVPGYQCVLNLKKFDTQFLSLELSEMIQVMKDSEVYSLYYNGKIYKNILLIQVSGCSLEYKASIRLNLNNSQYITYYIRIKPIQSGMFSYDTSGRDIPGEIERDLRESIKLRGLTSDIKYNEL